VFEGERYINLATFKRDGSAVRTPIWFAELDGFLYGFSEKRAGKMKRLRNSPRAQVAACDVRGRLRGEWHEATALAVQDPQAIDAAFTALRRKYGWQMRLADLLSTLSGRIRNRAVLRIEL
jgi:PPOX class probable F420-dependent enzyme